MYLGEPIPPAQSNLSLLMSHVIKYMEPHHVMCSLNLTSTSTHRPWRRSRCMMGCDVVVFDLVCPDVGVEWHSDAVPHLLASMISYRAHPRWACSSCPQSGSYQLQCPIAATHPSLLRRLHCIEMLRTISLQISYWLQCQGHLACP